MLAPAPNAPPAREAPAAPAPPAPRRRRLVAVAVVVVSLLVGLGYSGYMWSYWQSRVSTDDAFVEAQVTPVSARVSGTIVEVLVTDNQQVNAGQPLVRLDARDYELKREQAQAQVLIAQGVERSARAAVSAAEVEVQG